MKVRILHQFFHPDLAATAQIISQIAFHMAKGGDEVSVVCSRVPYDKNGRGSRPASEVVEGVSVNRVWGPALSRHSLPGRAINAFAFCLSAGWRALAGERADVVVFLTDPPFFPVLGAVLKRLRGERFVHVLMDLYPEVAVRAGKIREGGLADRLLRRLSRSALSSADSLIVLGDDMREAVIRAGADPERISVIRNWADTARIFPVTPEVNPFRKGLGLDGKFVISYSGNFGVSHDFGELLSVAQEWKEDPETRFLLIGDGARRREVDSAVFREGLENVLLLPYQAEGRLAESLSAGDIHYVSLRQGFEGLVVPSKAYGIMAAGRPILYQGSPQGEVARCVEREEIGLVIPPGDRIALGQAISFLKRNPALRLEMGRRARRAAEERYSSSGGLKQYREVIHGLAPDSGRA